MDKVPVGGSIAHAYQFLFGRFFQIIGTAWLPSLLFALGYFVILSNAPSLLTMPPASDPMSIAKLALSGLAVFAFVFVIRAVIGISLTQEALGVKKDLTLAHFVIGPRELRLFFAYVRYYLVFAVLYAVVLALAFGAMYAAQTYGNKLPANLAFNGQPVAVLAAGVFAIVLVIWFSLSMLRLFFFLAPVASVEHRTRLSRAWSISRGSSWRVLIVFLGTFVPAAVALGAAMYFLLGPNDIANLMATVAKAKPGDMAPLANFYASHAFMLAVVAGVATALFGALLAGASATAYRKVTGHEDPELEDDAALVAPLLAPVDGHGDSHGSHDDHGHGNGGHGDGHGDHGHGHDDHGHGGHGDHGHGNGHDDHGKGHDDHGHGGHGGHDDHGHGGHDDHAHGNGHDDHGHGNGHGHDDHGHGDGHGGHGDHGHGGHDDHGHGGGHGHDDHGHGHKDHAHGDHGHGNGHDDHGHGHDDHGDKGHGHDDHGHGGHGHDDHGHGDHGHGHKHHHAGHGHDHAKAA